MSSPSISSSDLFEKLQALGSIYSKAYSHIESVHGQPTTQVALSIQEHLVRLEELLALAPAGTEQAYATASLAQSSSAIPAPYTPEYNGQFSYMGAWNPSDPGAAQADTYSTSAENAQ